MPGPGTRVIEDTSTGYEPMYHLILLDDDDHTYEYVIAMLGAVFSYPREKAFAIACVVDSQGSATVMTGSKEEMTLKQEAIHAYGADPLLTRCKGSMTAVVEPVS